MGELVDAETTNSLFLVWNRGIAEGEWCGVESFMYKRVDRTR